MKKVLFVIISFFFLTSCSKNEQLKTDKQLIADYITSHHISGTVTTSTGLTYLITTEGTGAKPTATSNVKVNYKGYLLDSSVFDQSTAPVSFNLQQVIQGWKEGLTYFKKGGSGKLFVPSDYGYGSQAKPGIPANSVLIFDIDLLDVF